MDHVEQVAGLIKQYESRADKLRAIQSLLADDPALIDDLRNMLAPKKQAPKINVVTEFLRSKHNEWQTAAQIAQNTGLRRNTVNFLLFASAHKEKFESEMRGPKKKVWRLKVDPSPRVSFIQTRKDGEVKIGPEVNVTVMRRGDQHTCFGDEQSADESA
jgi:hypothetical protein